MLVTLGIYRFWLNTDMRRFLWSNTEVAGHGLEYTGTARELLIDRLMSSTRKLGKTLVNRLPGPITIRSASRIARIASG